MLRNLKKTTTEFCLQTYNHGFKFIALPQRKLSERILWIFITGLFIIITVTVLCISWMSIIHSTQTITLSDTPNHPIWNFVFPAVTVCNFNILSKNRTYEIAQKLSKSTNMSSEQLALELRLLYRLTDRTISYNIPMEPYRNLQDIIDKNNMTAESLLKYLSPTCKEMMKRCTWKSQSRSCDDLFEQIKTPFGFCCSFNYYAIKDHILGSNTSAGLKSARRPRRVTATGYQKGIQAAVNAYPDDYFLTALSSYGCRIMIHCPFNFPDGNVQSMFQSIDNLIFIPVTPSLYRSDSKVRNLQINHRKCLYPKERELRGFRYSYFNCINECRANLTIKMCGCIPFDFYTEQHGKIYVKVENPKISRYNAISFIGFYGNPRVCNLRDIFCISMNQSPIEELIVGHDKFTSKYRWSQSVCSKCLPDCNYYQFEIEGSSAKFYSGFVNMKPNLYGKIDLQNISVFRVYFDDLVANRYTTSVKNYWHTLLGLFGGLLSLFTGFSLVSIIELIYFFTLRPILDCITRPAQQNKE